MQETLKIYKVLRTQYVAGDNGIYPETDDFFEKLFTSFAGAKYYVDEELLSEKALQVHLHRGSNTRGITSGAYFPEINWVNNSKVEIKWWLFEKLGKEPKEITWKQEDYEIEELKVIRK